MKLPETVVVSDTAGNPLFKVRIQNFQVRQGVAYGHLTVSFDGFVVQRPRRCACGEEGIHLRGQSCSLPAEQRMPPSGGVLLAAGDEVSRGEVIAEEIEFKSYAGVPCECGAAKLNYPRGPAHSSWCPWGRP